MSYCINPLCPQPDDPGNMTNLVCRHCGSDLLLQGRYRVMRLLSDQSGFGKVYEAYNGAVPKILKVLKPEHNSKSKIIELFRQEAAVLSKLTHPGIPQIEPEGYFQFFPRHSKEPLYCIIMEKIDGLNLKQWMRQQGNHPILETQALKWLKQIVEILHLVHQQNYFHRDIKPENIMLRANGQLVLIDFGTARELTYTYLAEIGGGGSVTKISSHGYTPPEQEKGYAVPQSDFYALGRTFVYLLTGKSVTDQSVYDPLNDQFHWRDHAPQISDQLADFIDSLMAPTAAARPQKTQQILNNLANIYSISSLISISQANTNLEASTTNSSIKTKSQPNISIQTEVIKTPKIRWWLGGILTLGFGLFGAGGWLLYQSYNPDLRKSQEISPEELSVVNTKTFTAHSSWVNYLVISQDGELLVSASADKTIKIWDINTGEAIHTLEGHKSYVNYLAISPDGQQLFSASADKTIKIWDINTGEKIYTLEGHKSFINHLAVSPDGQRLFSASADKTIKIWDINTGEKISQLKGHESAINFLLISQNEQKLFSASADKTIKIWDINTGQVLRTLEGHTSFVNSLAISPDGQRLFSASADKTIKVWNLDTGEEVNSLTDHSNYVEELAIGANCKKLFSGSADQTIKVWDFANQKLIYTLIGFPNPIEYFAISPDCHTIATSGGKKIIKLWQVPQ
ncbi:serine/threonine-protein kinase [Moorena sp. SIO3H5]|uniref:serine/threonine-protein kinase n=1 Tax=Moorena sp. SIO3H5 TaxID=2607834 RepID=UPI0013BD48A3|nr:serine/threonine-protein kinase [Moorena sp. SIO3H5]NEO70460.1 protein kinase [Moorena sp. SIO3H5]